MMVNSFLIRPLIVTPSLQAQDHDRIRRIFPPRTPRFFLRSLSPFPEISSLPFSQRLSSPRPSFHANFPLPRQYCLSEQDESAFGPVTSILPLFDRRFSARIGTACFVQPAKTICFSVGRSRLPCVLRSLSTALRRRSEKEPV